MDKYEYKLKTKQMLELMEEGAYRKAAEIADTIDWRRVRNTTMLDTVSEIYEKNRDFLKSYEVLRIAYNRAEGSRKIISRLCTLALKIRNVDQAIGYYRDFMKVAPKDPNQYILRYQILRAQRAPIQQQIHELETFKKAEYIEEWAYELAKLYREAGMISECLEECDDLILWFSEGKFVYQAMELKMQYKPLTPVQQEKYDHRNDKVAGETEELPDLTEYKSPEVRKAERLKAAQKPRPLRPSLLQTVGAVDVPPVAEPAEVEGVTLEDVLKEAVQPVAQEEAVAYETTSYEATQEEEAVSEVTQEEASVEQTEEPEKPKKRLGSTMKLDEALKALLNIRLKSDDTEELSEEDAEAFDEEEDLSELEDKIEEIEAVADLELVEKVAVKKKKKRESVYEVDTDLEELLPDPEDMFPEPDEELAASVSQVLEEEAARRAKAFAEAEELVEEELPEAEELVEEEPAVEETTEAEEATSDVEVLGAEAFAEAEEPAEVEEPAEAEEPAEVEEFVELEEPAEAEVEPEYLENEPEVHEGEEQKGIEDGPEAVEGVIQESMTAEDMTPEDTTPEKEGAMEEKNTKTTPILSPEIQALIDEIEGNIPAKPAVESEPAEVEMERDASVDVVENRGAEADELRMDDEFDEYEDEDFDFDDEDEEFDEYEEEDFDFDDEDEEFDEYEEEDFDFDDEDEEFDGYEEEDFDFDDEDEEFDEYEDVEEEDFDEEDEEFDEYEEEYDDYDSYDEDDEEEGFVWGVEDAVDAAEAEGFTVAYEEPRVAEPAETFGYGEDEDDFEEELFEEEYTDEYAEDTLEDEADASEDAFDEATEDDFAEDFEEDFEDDFEDDFVEDLEEEEFEEDAFDYEDAEEYDDDVYESAEDFAEGFAEEFRPRDDLDEIDDREIPDEDDDMDILSKTTPLSRKETAKLIATGKTAPLPLDEISDALSNTGFIVHGRYDLEMQSGIGTRAGLTDEQKKLFSYFVPVRGMSEQLVDVLEQDKNCTNRKGTSRTGNLLIIGNKGNGKTVLAVDVVKAIQKQRKIRQGKVAIVTGDALNKKKISDVFEKLYGGALIIEKAGKLNEKTVARLNKAMERDTGELLLVLEDQRKPLDRLLTSNREFRRKFTSRLEVPVFINDELVTFGQTYAQENGYRIDEMSILALYSRIDSLQREDHAVTIAEVKEIMDEAMAHSQKASAKKLVRRVFGRNTDESDRIILTEKDFNI